MERRRQIQLHIYWEVGLVIHTSHGEQPQLLNFKIMYGEKLAI